MSETRHSVCAHKSAFNSLDYNRLGQFDLTLFNRIRNGFETADYGIVKRGFQIISKTVKLICYEKYTFVRC